MTSPLSPIFEPLNHGFMQNAFAAIVLVGVICGVMGVFVTLRGLAFMGDAMAHAVFPGVVISSVLGGSFLVGAVAAATVVSLAIGVVSQSGLLRHDTAIGVFFVGSFALGVAIISTRQTYARDITNLLFGSILGVSRYDLLLTGLVGCAVVIALWLARREIVTISFDRTFAQSQGLNPWGWDQLFLLLLSLTIVISLQTVGNVLVLAMLVTPAATARLLTIRLGAMIVISALIGAVAGIAGLYLSYYRGISSGASIVLVATAIFVAVFLFAPGTGAITARVMRRLHFSHPERDRFTDEDPAATRV
ncbi:MAG: metal ABC transporter permease [Chloroflexota bacterium]|nr:metal ABC transporter permease [Chloroflexia bacterium]MDQ3227656.1 metal ABC transporter permease [Chloroflexota bacterium]